MPASDSSARRNWRVVVVGGHTRSIGKTQLVCDIIQAFPEASWIAGKITQYGHGVCARIGENCDCAPSEHAAALDWETRKDTGTDTARFLAAGARRALWLRTKQGFLAEGLPLLRAALYELAGAGKQEPGNLILESNSLLQFLKPSLYVVVLAPARADFKETARLFLDRADAVILRSPFTEEAQRSFGEISAWSGVPLVLIEGKRCFLQREGDALPAGLRELTEAILQAGKGVPI